MIHKRLYQKCQIVTLDDLYKARTPGAKDIRKRRRSIDIDKKPTQMEKWKERVPIDTFFNKSFAKAEVKGYTRVRRGKMERVDPFYRHQLAIARKTLLMTPEMANIMGGMTVEDAKKFMDKHKEGERKRARENRHAREDAYRSVGLVRGKDSMGRTLWE